MKTLFRLGLLAATVGLFATDADARGGRCGSPCYVPCWTPCCDPCPPCPPCWPCEQPNVAPLNPPPEHPTPHSYTAATLKFANNSGAEFFAIAYLRYPDPCFPCGVFKPYRKYSIPAGGYVTSPANDYWAGDEVLIQTWWRVDANHPWHCYHTKLITLKPTGTYDLVTGVYTSP